MDPRLAVPRNFVSLRETRFRGDDDVFFRYRQIIRHSRIGKLFVIPGRRSRTRNPWGSSIRCGLKPIDPRFRGDNGAALKRLRKRHAGLARLCACLSKHLRHSGAA